MLNWTDEFPKVGDELIVCGLFDKWLNGRFRFVSESENGAGDGAICKLKPLNKAAIEMAEYSAEEEGYDYDGFAYIDLFYNPSYNVTTGKVYLGDYEPFDEDDEVDEDDLPPMIKRYLHKKTEGYRQYNHRRRRLY